jgi:hypothetical protein
MKIDPETMSITEMMYWLANEDGWMPVMKDGPNGQEEHFFNETDAFWLSYHPFPSSLDGARSAIKAPWEWSKYPGGWFADNPDTFKTVHVKSSCTEVRDFFVLAVKTRLADKGDATVLFRIAGKLQ